MYWMIAALVAVFGVALVGRTGLPQRSTDRREAKSTRPPRPPVEPLKPGEIYDTAAKLATLPNAPLADLWCQRLREEGIEAFYRDSVFSPFPGLYGGPVANPGLPAEVWVGEHDVQRARELFPELA